MRKLILFIATSLDGYIAGPERPGALTISPFEPVTTQVCQWFSAKLRADAVQLTDRR